ncbi:MAG: hypothetical protein GY832_15465 [Chloroflexi bacterium]|nr:hypothetical protein [Chloroflexota bacterium]
MSGLSDDDIAALQELVGKVGIAWICELFNLQPKPPDRLSRDKRLFRLEMCDYRLSVPVRKTPPPSFADWSSKPDPSQDDDLLTATVDFTKKNVSLPARTLTFDSILDLAHVIRDYKV